MEEGVLTGLGGARGQEETGNWEGRQLEMFESTSLCNRSECFHSNTYALAIHKQIKTT